MKSKMYVKMFAETFVPLIQSGKKKQTIRTFPKRTCDIPTDLDCISCRRWTGKPYRSKQEEIGFESADGIKLVRSVSTDGCRLAYSECVQASETPGGIAVLIPKKGLEQVVKFLDSDGTVQIGVKGNSFIVKKDAETIIIRLLEGDFPKYAEILLPADDSVPLRIDRQGFLATLKRMSILYSENNKGVKIKLSPGQMTVSAKNPDLGESKETLDISYDGAVFEVAFNPKYLIGVLSVIKDGMALVTIIDERRPCLIEGEADKSYRSVIMPMRA